MAMDASGSSALGDVVPNRLLGLSATVWSRVRLGAMGAYLVATALYLRSTEAIPSDREIIAGWILGLALVATIGRTRRDVLVTLASWVPFLLALFLYDFARAVGHWIDAPLAVKPQITLDRWLGGGRLWTERLQGWLVSPKAGLGRLTVAESERILKTDGSTVRWYDILVSAVYQSHFLIPYLTAGVLWQRRTRWRWYAGTFVVVNFVSCAIFALYATAPPWYAAQKGLIDPFPRVLAGRAWSHVGLTFASRVIEKGQGTVNPFAAIPSLHSAQALMVAVFLWGLVWKPLRPLLVLYPLTMAFALVYSGEHYLIDVFAGWGMVALALTLGWKARQRWGWASPFRWTTKLHGHATTPTHE
jgi:membrane-associated phospholipid phosphatase